MRVDNEPCADACIRIRRLSANVRDSQNVFRIVVRIIILRKRIRTLQHKKSKSMIDRKIT